MRNWEEYVRERLALPELAPAREDRIVRELAEQLEEFYRDALVGGMDAVEADACACRQFSDWNKLVSDLRDAGRCHQQTKGAACWRTACFFAA